MTTEISAETRALLALSMVKGIGPAALRQIAQVPGFQELRVDLLKTALKKNVAASLDEAVVASALDNADQQIEMAALYGARVISCADPDYPSLLAQTRDDPQVLFVRGQLASSPEKSVAVIGTREPTDHGKVVARRMTEFFIHEGWSIVSGLAIGCDAIAHETAVEAAGHTVAVLAHGLQTISPKSHYKLAERILETGGALVTAYRMGQEPIPANFVRRDRTQAGLAQGVVMIQSDLKGGSLFASRAAIEYGRRLSVPHPTDQDLSRREPKVQANLLLASGSDKEKAHLLQCGLSDLDRLLIIRSKADYGQMIGDPDAPAPPMAQNQMQLL